MGRCRLRLGLEGRESGLDRLEIDDENTDENIDEAKQ